VSGRCPHGSLYLGLKAGDGYYEIRIPTSHPLPVRVRRAPHRRVDDRDKKIVAGPLEPKTRLALLRVVVGVAGMPVAGRGTYHRAEFDEPLGDADILRTEVTHGWEDATGDLEFEPPVNVIAGFQTTELGLEIAPEVELGEANHHRRSE